MDRITNYVPNSLVASADLNKLQDRIRSVRRASKDAELTDWVQHSDSIIFQKATTQIAAGADEQLDGARDFRGHLVEGWIATPGSSTQRINGANEYNINTALESAIRFIGFLGTGSTTAFGATDYYIRADWNGATWNWNLYCDTSNGHLYLRNRSGSARRVIIMVESIGREP